MEAVVEEFLLIIDDNNKDKFSQMLDEHEVCAYDFIEYTLKTKNKVMLEYIIELTGVNISLGLTNLQHKQTLVNQLKDYIIPRMIKKNIISDPKYAVWLVDKFIIPLTDPYVFNILTQQTAFVHLQLAERIFHYQPNSYKLLRYIIKNDNDTMLSYLRTEFSPKENVWVRFIKSEMKIIDAPNCRKLLIAEGNIDLMDVACNNVQTIVQGFVAVTAICAIAYMFGKHSDTVSVHCNIN